MFRADDSRMAREPAVRERNPWLPWFIISVALLAGALTALAVVLLSAISDDSNPAHGQSLPGETTTPEPDISAGLTYSGELPPAATDLGLADQCQQTGRALLRPPL